MSLVVKEKDGNGNATASKCLSTMLIVTFGQSANNPNPHRQQHDSEMAQGYASKYQ
jgi:hypothetical protein